MEKQIIHYGIGKDYLPNWGLPQALREIYQNFIDYGEYDAKSVKYGENVVVTITNDYKPETLEFLRIGMSNKGGNINAIGKHGEGLKMALLVMARMDMFCIIKFENEFIEYIF